MNKCEHACAQLTGTHYVHERSLEAVLNGGEGFTMAQLIDANIGRFKGGVYLGGKFSFPDTEFQHKYDFVPYGLVSRCEERYEGETSAEDGQVRRSERHATLQSLMEYDRDAAMRWDSILTRFGALRQR